MNRTFAVTRHTRRDRKNAESWKVEGSGPEGRRIRRFFPSKALAAKYASAANGETQAIGWQAMGLSDQQRVEASKCYAVLAPSGISLTAAVQGYLAQKSQDFCAMTVAEVAREILTNKALMGLSDPHLRTTRCHFRKFVKAFGTRKITTITRRELSSWLRLQSLPAPTFKAVRTHLNLLFRYCVTEGYLRDNPAAKIPTPKQKPIPPGILTVAAVKKVLELTRALHPDMLAAIALQCFAGLRRAEVKRLTWTEISFERGYVEVSAANSKTAQRRLIPICDPLRRILMTVRREDGPVIPKCFDDKFAGVRAALIQSKLTWPRNALRHSFASYHLALHQDAAKSALQLGHKNTSTLFEHYRELVTPEAASEWFGSDDSSAAPSAR